MLKKMCFMVVRNPKMKFWLKKSAAVIRKTAPDFYNKFFYQLKNYIRNAIYEEGYLNTSKDSLQCNWPMRVEESNEHSPLISIIVPNYNHADYLEERLSSIFQQNYKNFEVILLDDCSNDNSVCILEKYKEQYSNITTLYVNDENSGGVFKQWNKGILLAKGDYVWIAESDDYCDQNFLTSMVPLLSDESVMLAFCRSTFVQDGKEIYTTEEYLHELNYFNWDQTFSATAHDMVRHGWALKNIIPNVSSVVFRNIGRFPPEVTNIWTGLKLCGDWLFYLSLAKGGVVAYTNTTTNYYRVHSESTSLKIQSTPRYYQEFEILASYIARNYDVSDEVFEKQRQSLKEHYLCFQNNASDDDIDQWYRLDIIKKEMQKRLPNIMIAGFSMVMGGGETFPIALANALKRQGLAVTFFDFEMSEYDEKVRKMLNPEVPLVKVSKLFSLADAIKKMGIDIMHSHHACVDEVLSQLLILNPDLQSRQVITLHGMYDAIDNKDLNRLLGRISQTCNLFVYTADKNLNVFEKRVEFSHKNFVKIRNGLLDFEIFPIDRTVLNIEENAFVLCLVSRGIPEKGWEEAVAAVKLARVKSHLDIQLLLIGDGEMYDSISKNCPSFVHLLGVKSNIRDYFACSDMGFLPSRFRGESFPLVVIDSLFSGKPVIASNIGEIKYQLSGEKGAVAGALFDLSQWEIPVETLAELIIVYAKRGEEYKLACDAVKKAREKFDIYEVAEQYLEVYKNCCRKGGEEK